MFTQQKTDQEVIEKAMEILSHEGAWCQGSSSVVEIVDEKVITSRCILSALWAAAGEHAGFQVSRLAGKICVTNKITGVAAFNDAATTTQEDVILALKKTLEALDSQ